MDVVDADESAGSLGVLEAVQCQQALPRAHQIKRVTGVPGQQVLDEGLREVARGADRTVGHCVAWVASHVPLGVHGGLLGGSLRWTYRDCGDSLRRSVTRATLPS